MSDRNPFIFMTRGIPASGKSSWTRLVAQRVFEETGRRITIISLDDLREVLHQNARIHYFDRDDEDMVQRIQMEVIRQALLIGHDVIVHNTHCSPSPANRVLAMVQEDGLAADLYIVHFAISLEEAKARNKLRSRRVPAHVIDSMQNTLAKRLDQWGDKKIITPAEAEALMLPADEGFEDLMAAMREDD